MPTTPQSLQFRDMRQMSPAAQEELRLRVVGAVLRDGLTQMAAAKTFGVSRVSVNSWCRSHARGGAKALESRPRGRAPGDGAALAPWQCAKICNMIRDRCPDQLKFQFFLWTREAVGLLIQREFGIELAVTTLGNYLRRWGFTVQKPAVRAYEQNPAKVIEWLNVRYPGIAERAKKEGAAIWWGDEAGLRSRHVAGTTFSPSGKTPIVRATGKYFGCNMVAAINNRGELAFRLFEGSFNAAVFQDFLERMVAQSSCKIFLIVDNLAVHHAKALQPWLKEHETQIELFFLPSYSPELNPA
jgi:transposase